MEQVGTSVSNEELQGLPPRYWRLARFIVDALDRRQRTTTTRLEHLLERIDEIQEKIMSTQDDLNAAVASINANLDAIEAEIKQLQAANPTIDLSGLLNLVSRTRNDVPAPTPPPGP